MMNIIAELPDGCFPVFIYEPHPEGGSYCVDARVYGLGNRLPRFVSYFKESQMSEQDKKEATVKAGRAARQARHAANNAGGAAEAAAEYAKDEIVEGASAVKDGVQALTKKAVYTEVGRGAIFFGLGLITMSVGFKKLGDATRMRNQLRTAAAATIMPEG
jgi:hypothetical protein